jgi:hypothetical protein
MNNDFALPPDETFGIEANVETASRKKVWRTPRVITSKLSHTEHGTTPPGDGGHSTHFS